MSLFHKLINTWYFLYLIFSNLMNKKWYLSVVLICTFFITFVSFHMLISQSFFLLYEMSFCVFYLFSYWIVSFLCWYWGNSKFNSHPSLVVYCRCIGISSEFVTCLYTLMAGVVNFNELSAFFFMVCSFCIF